MAFTRTAAYSLFAEDRLGTLEAWQAGGSCSVVARDLQGPERRSSKNRIGADDRWWQNRIFAAAAEVATFIRSIGRLRRLRQY